MDSIGLTPPLIDPATGLPIDPSMMIGGPPPVAMGIPGPMGPAPMPAGPMGPPPAPPPPEPDPGIPVDPMVEFIAVLLSGDDEAIQELLDGLDRVALAMLRDFVEEEIKPEFPAPAKHLLRLLPRKKSAGTLPSWMAKAPSRPDIAQVREIATRDALYWDEVIKNDQDTMEYLMPPFKGHVYKTFDKKKDELYISPMLRNEVNLVVNKGSASGYYYRILTTDPAHAEMAQQSEDYLYECDRQAQRIANARGLGDVERNEWFSVTAKGRVITMIQPDHSTCDWFLNEQTIDPSTTFPIWDGHGLMRVTRIYDAMLADAIGEYDTDGTLEAKVIGKNVTSKDSVYKPDTWVKVTCYWDRWWYVVLFDDIEIRTVPHKYGFVPFAVTGSNVGLPVFMGDITIGPMSSSPVHADPQLKLKFASHVDAMKEFAGQREKVMSVLNTQLAKTGKRAKILYQNPLSQARGVPQISDEINKINPLDKDNEELAEMPNDTIDQATFQPFYSMFSQDAATTFMPGEAHGVSAGANQSGNALENMFEVGNDKMVPHYKALAAHKQAKNELRLALWRDWGHAWKDRHDNYGKLSVPYSSSKRATMPMDAPPAFEFIPEVVEMLGCVAEVEYTQVRMQNLTQLGNAFMIWNQGGAMSAREAMEMRGVRDPDAVFAQVALEKIMLDPEMIKLQGLEELRKRNPDLADKYEQRTGGGNQMTGGTPPGIAPNSSAMNLTALGMGAVDPTGRPPVGGGVGVPPI